MMARRPSSIEEVVTSLKPSIAMQDTIGPVAVTIRLKMTTTDHDFDAKAIAAAIEQFRAAVIGSVVVRDAVPA